MGSSWWFNGRVRKTIREKGLIVFLYIKGVIMFKSVLIAVSSAVVVVATGYVSLIGLIVVTSM